MDPIRPPNTGLTPEAAEALAKQGIPVEPEVTLLPDDDMDSEQETGDTGIPEPDFNNPFTAGIFAGETGDDIPEAEIVDEPRSARTALPAGSSKEKKEPRQPKSGPPSLDEWAGFLSRVVLRVLTDYYIWWAFRGIDENVLSQKDIDRLKLTEDERTRIVTPLAELANKSKYMRKHGRMIVASGESVDALITLGIWFSRVSRVAAKYRPPAQKKPARRRDHSHNERSRPASEVGSNGHANGANGGSVTGAFRIYNPGSG